MGLISSNQQIRHIHLLDMHTVRRETLGEDNSLDQGVEGLLVARLLNIDEARMILLLGNKMVIVCMGFFEMAYKRF